MIHVKMADGIEEIGCYENYWLDKDMENMGYLFEYCEKYCRQLYDNNIKLDKIKFLTNFMKSDIRKLMDIGWPNLISQAAIDSCRKFIEVDNQGSLEEYRLLPDKKQVKYKHSQLYWVGWIYAYIHFTSKKLSKDIVEKLPIKEMLIDYKCGHEMSKEVYYDKIKWIFEK